jgi:hypothetical protein
VFGIELQRARPRSEFVPGHLPTTLRNTSRPSGIPQVLRFGD